MYATSILFSRYIYMENFLKGKKVALIDMDGVIYDSMKYHVRAWQQIVNEENIPFNGEDIYIYEGMVGTSIIDMIYRKATGKGVSKEQAQELYNRKSQLFRQIGHNDPMPGTARMLAALKEAGIRRILVTGSAQHSLLDNINIDFPGAFEPGDRITALDVTHGKPDPEPYLKGLALAGVKPEEAIVIENAPLGVRSGKSAGIFTVAVTTGPVPEELFEKEGADLIFPSMPDFASVLEKIIEKGL